MTRAQLLESVRYPLPVFDAAWKTSAPFRVFCFLAIAIHRTALDVSGFAATCACTACHELGRFEGWPSEDEEPRRSVREALWGPADQ